MDKDRIAGAAEQAKGKVKETAGKVVGDTKLKREGKVEQAEGKLRNCLFALDEVDIKPLLRGHAQPEEIADTIRRNVLAKWEGHEINTARFIKPLRTMHAIGG